MKRLLDWRCFALATTAVVLTAANSPDNSGPNTFNGPFEHFYLRANCLHEPWHGRHLVTLPTSQQLGLENFTVHPETPPMKFILLEVTNGNYALQGVQVEDQNHSRTEIPFLAALKSKTGTRTASMTVVYLSWPDRSIKKFYLNTCPAGYTCVLDQWTFDTLGADMVRTNFRFAGFDGKWEPFKDAGKEGWHVYWKGNAGLFHPIQLDLAPVDGDE